MAVMTWMLSALYDLQTVAVGARWFADRPVTALNDTLALEGLPVGDEGAELEALPFSVVPSAAVVAGSFAGSAAVHQSMVEVAAMLAAATLAAQRRAATDQYAAAAAFAGA